MSMTITSESGGEKETKVVKDQESNNDCTNLSARKGVLGRLSVEIPPPAMDYFGSDEYSSEHGNVESWLDEHPEFFQAYLIRKGTRSMIDSWLVTHALPPGVTATTLQNVDEEDLDELNSDEMVHESDGAINVVPSDDCGMGGNSNSSASDGAGGISGIAIPASNVSGLAGTGSKFSACGSKCSSGSGTPVRKISAHEFEKGGLTKPLVNTIDGTSTFLSPTVPVEATGQIRKKSRNDVQGLNETDLIFELVKDICNDLEIRSLCHKILQNVGILTSADR